jgi:hypothetical protein
MDPAVESPLDHIENTDSPVILRGAAAVLVEIPGVDRAGVAQLDYPQDEKSQRRDR